MSRNLSNVVIDEDAASKILRTYLGKTSDSYGLNTSIKVGGLNMSHARSKTLLNNPSVQSNDIVNRFKGSDVSSQMIRPDIVDLFDSSHAQSTDTNLVNQGFAHFASPLPKNSSSYYSHLSQRHPKVKLTDS